MYSRETELRHLRPNDIYKLGVILDDNNCWKQLMEIIPKELNAQTSSSDGTLNWDQLASAGLKYNNDHIAIIENAIRRPGESRLFSQILFDEWSTSGRKHERPTVGVLLQLLVKAELFRAADFVAFNFLNEPPPPRPLNGPAARIDISLSDDIFNDIKDMVNDSSYYPGTESINDNANSIEHNNKDYYTKYQDMDKHVAINDNAAPIPPPRALRSARLQLQQQLQQQMATEASTIEAISNNEHDEERQQRKNHDNHIFTAQNIPNLMTNLSDSNISTSTDSNIHMPNTESTNLSEAPIPIISILEETSSKSNHLGAEAATSMIDMNEVLPVISALNLNGERYGSRLSSRSLVHNLTSSPSHSHTETSRSSSFSNDSIGDDIELPNIISSANEDHDDGGIYDDDEEDYEDNSVPNLSIFDQRSSNNDSSLTTVTGTSGENSFELSMNDNSTASTENIPCLKQ